jgi:hypothetical protein
MGCGLGGMGTGLGSTGTGSFGIADITGLFSILGFTSLAFLGFKTKYSYGYIYLLFFHIY